MHRLDICGPGALSLRGMWDLLGPGIELMSPALVGGVFIIELPGKPLMEVYTESKLFIRRTALS